MQNKTPHVRTGCMFELARFILALLLVCLVLWYFFRTVENSTPAEAAQNGKELLSHKRVLAVAAHPDDLEWYVGGTLRLLHENGARVEVIVTTDGERGRNLQQVEDLAAARREEQMAAGKVLGYDKIHMPGFPDRFASRGKKPRQYVQEIWEKFNPDLVLSFDGNRPSLPYLHNDHQGTGRIVEAYWRSLPSEKRPSLYLWQTRRPDTYIDISGVIDVKAEALRQHKSQNAGAGGSRMREIHAGYGKLINADYAERFRQIKK